MRNHPWLVTTLTQIVSLGLAIAALAESTTSAHVPSVHSTQPSTLPPSRPDDLRALDGEWTYVEDRTEGKTLEQLGPPMSSTFLLRVEEGAAGAAGTAGAVILNGHGSGHRDVRIALDGSVTEIAEPKAIARYRGSWKGGTFEYKVEFERVGDNPPEGSIRWIQRSFRVTPDGLLVRVAHDLSSGTDAIALYRHAADIPMPTPAKVAGGVGDLAWLAGAWVGTRSSGSSIEERWSPAMGGAMLATSRTVNTSGKMVAFEYLRIVERDGGLVYIAQPGGKAPTEFVLTELETGNSAENAPSPTPARPRTRRAVFENPRHDYPKRIVYELSAEGEGSGGGGSLTATIGYLKGGTPRRFEFRREGK